MAKKPVTLDVDFAARAYETLCNSRFSAQQFETAIRSSDPQDLRTLVDEAGISISDSVEVMFQAHKAPDDGDSLQTPFVIVPSAAI